MPWCKVDLVKARGVSAWLCSFSVIKKGKPNFDWWFLTCFDDRDCCSMASFFSIWVTKEENRERISFPLSRLIYGWNQIENSDISIRSFFFFFFFFFFF